MNSPTRMMLAALAASALLASPALADGWHKQADLSSPDCPSTISSGGKCWYVFTGTTDSVIKEITAEYGTVCFDPNLSSSGAANAQVQVMRVLDSSPQGAAGVLATSEVVISLTMTSESCIYEVPTGRYWINVTAGASGDTAVVSVEGARS